MITCFWCEKILTEKERTKDHVIPKYMKKKVSMVVVCCGQCNMERSQLSSIAASNRVRKHKQISQERKLYYLALITKYRKRILNKLQEIELDICLYELDIVQSRLQS